MVATMGQTYPARVTATPRSAPAEPEAHTVDAPGAVLHYFVRRNDASHEPPLLLIGSPMPSDGFATLAGHFPDRTVVTFDPRGAGRSKRTDGALQSTTEEHAGDLRRLITALGSGTVDVFATSGGAVNALALAARHPEQLRILVAHEPPAASVLPDADAALATCEAIRATYHREGYGPAMAKFIALVSIAGPIPAEFAAQPAPDPAMFGLPADDDGSRDDPLVGLNMPATVAHEHDFDALRAAPTRIVVGVGAESRDAMAGRAAVAIAERLRTTAVTFPGGHDGFLGGEFGRTGEPDAFADILRQVLNA